MSDTLTLIRTGRGRVRVVRGAAAGAGDVVVLRPDDAYEEIGYADWAARAGEEVDVEAYRQALMAEGSRALVAEMMGDDADAGLPCPRCGGALARGAVRLDTTVFGAVVAGRSYQHLFFEADAGGERPAVVRQGERVAAARCAACGGVWIDGPAG